MTDKDLRQQTLAKLRQDTLSIYGARSAALGSEKFRLNVVPTPSLMLDYKLGIGGFPYGAMVEIFGNNGLGKTTVLGYGVLANVQREGKLPALIAMEPHAGFDVTVEWAQKIHGLDPDLLYIAFPDNVQEAFEMLYELVYDSKIDYIMVDSIGAMGNVQNDKDPLKKKAYGVSGEVTDGLNKIMPRLYKANKGLCIINQQRHSGSANNQTFYESPGGEALKHHARVRIQLKPGTNKYFANVDGEKVLVGRELKCAFKKNSMAQAVNKSAEFDFFHITTEEYGLGIDKATDVINTAKVAGVIKPAGSWLQHEIFPDGKIQGVAKARQFFMENPDAYTVIREGVIQQMLEREFVAEQEKRARLQAVA